MHAEPSSPPGEIEPMRVQTRRVVAAGVLLWLIALLATAVLPELRTGERWWWPWSCVAGLVLGMVGLVYVRRGRGNAADA